MTEPTNKELRGFVCIVSIGFALMGLWSSAVRVPFLSAALTVAGLYRLRPRLLRWPFRLWMILGEVLGRLNAHVVLSLFYFLVLVPLGMAKRIFGSDALGLSFDSNKKSYAVAASSRKADHFKFPF